MRSLPEHFHEFVHLDRKREGDGITPAEYSRWLFLRAHLDDAFGSRPPSGGERRGSLRVPTRLKVTYDEASGLDGTVTNLSRTGCFVRARLPAVVGARLMLVIGLGDGAVLEVPGQVVSCQAGREPGMGICFTHPSPEVRKQLDLLYEGLAAGSH